MKPFDVPVHICDKAPKDKPYIINPLITTCPFCGAKLFGGFENGKLKDLRENEERSRKQIKALSTKKRDGSKNSRKHT